MKRCVGEVGCEDSADSGLGCAGVMTRPLHVLFFFRRTGEVDMAGGNGKESGLWRVHVVEVLVGCVERVASSYS